ncbi:hypothetical protein [Flaviaesturariibacter terrae]
MTNIFNAVVEDQLTDVLLQKVSAEKGLEIAHVYGNSGNAYIRRNLHRFYQASKQFPYLIVTDLDALECPIKLRQKWEVPDTTTKFCLRVAVREVEAWIMSDRKSFAEFLGISQAAVPLNIEENSDPKALLINLAKRSRKRIIREGIVPLDKYTSIGPLYNDLLSEFVTSHWSSEAACEASPSCLKLINTLEYFKENQGFLPNMPI